MAHHSIGDVGERTPRAPGPRPIGGMGAVSAAIESSARSLGAEIRTRGSGRHGSSPRGGRSAASCSTPARRSPLRSSSPPRTRRSRSSQQLDQGELPEEFVDGHPELEVQERRGEDQSRARSRARVHRGPRSIAISPVVSSSPTRSRTSRRRSRRHARRAGVGSRSATASCRRASIPRWRPRASTWSSLFTQWCPAAWADEPHADELDAYADRVIDGYDELAPGFADSVLHLQVIGPHEMETEWGLVGGNIFHGELSAEQLFHMRPAPATPTTARPIRGLYQCSSATHGGGGVCGIPAYNCVREIVRDVRRARSPARRMAAARERAASRERRDSRSTSRAGTRSLPTSRAPSRPGARAGISTTTC